MGGDLFGSVWYGVELEEDDLDILVETHSDRIDGILEDNPEFMWLNTILEPLGLRVIHFTIEANYEENTSFQWIIVGVDSEALICDGLSTAKHVFLSNLELQPTNKTFAEGLSFLKLKPREPRLILGLDYSI